MLIQSFLLGTVYQAYIYYIPLYLQNARKFDVLTSAAIIVSMVGTQSIWSIAAGQYISRRKRYGEIIVFGFGIWTV